MEVHTENYMGGGAPLRYLTPSAATVRSRCTASGCRWADDLGDRDFRLSAGMADPHPMGFDLAGAAVSRPRKTRARPCIMAAPAPPCQRKNARGVTSMQLFSTITCPACGHHRMEEMPEDACRFFYDCTTCGVRMKPKPGDCCVFCSYGDVPCPPVQAARENGDRSACCRPDRGS
jgi:hypothetical protein